MESMNLSMLKQLKVSQKFIFFFRSVVVIILLSTLNFYAQGSHPTTNPLGGNVVFGLDAGITYPQTDYQIVKLGLSGRTALEYYFNVLFVLVLALTLLLRLLMRKAETVT